MHEGGYVRQRQRESRLDGQRDHGGVDHFICDLSGSYGRYQGGKSKLLKYQRGTLKNKTYLQLGEYNFNHFPEGKNPRLLKVFNYERKMLFVALYLLL